MKINFTTLRVVACLVIGLSVVNTGRGDPTPYPNAGTPVAAAQTLMANGGEVTVQMPNASGALYDDYLYLFSPAPALTFDPGPPPTNYIFWNHGSPGTVSLGTFAAGTVMTFALYTGVMYDTDNDPQTPDQFEPLSTWYTGPSDQNEDGFVHTYMVNNYGGDPNATYVAFEDLNGGADGTGSDWNYQDIEFVFTGVASVPEPSTPTLLGLGLAVFSGYSLRSKKQNATDDVHQTHRGSG